MLVAGRRRALHRRAAVALAALYPERAGELHPLLAHHYLAAEAWAEAAEHARRAAEAAHRAWANREALARYDQAVLAAARAGLPAAARCVVLQARADVHATLGSFEPARADLEAALALAEQDGDAVAQGQVLTDLGARWGGHKDYARGLELTRRAVDVLAPAGASQALAGARAQLGVMLLNLVRMTESRRELEAALALFRELDDAPGQGRALEMLAMNLWLSGHVGSAVAAVEEALPKLAAAGERRGEITALVGLGAARAWGDKMSSGRPSLERALAIALVLEARSDEAFVRCCVADFGMEAGAYGAAFRESSTALAIARELGHLEWTVYALDVLGRVHAECGAWAEARVLHEEELGLARLLGAALWIADALGNVGNDLLEAGDLDGARGYLEEAVQVAGECAEKAVHPLARLGDLAILAGRPRDALEASARLRATAGEYRVFAIQAKRIEAEAWALLGRPDDAEAALVDVIREAERAEATPTRWRAELALAEVLLSRGDQVRAREAAARALALLEARDGGASAGPERRARRLPAHAANPTTRGRLTHSTRSGRTRRPGRVLLPTTPRPGTPGRTPWWRWGPPFDRRARRFSTSTWSASHGVIVFFGDPPHSIAKPRPGQPGLSGSAAPREPADVFGDVHPATPIRPVAVSFESGSMKPG